MPTARRSAFPHCPWSGTAAISAKASRCRCSAPIPRPFAPSSNDRIYLQPATLPEAPMTRVQDIYPANRVILREVGLRDGLQLVKTFPSTAAKQRWIRDEYAAGVRHFEVGSF